MTSKLDRVIEWVIEHPLLEKLLTFYHSQSSRDQNALKGLFSFILAIGLIFGLAVPAHKSLMAAISEYETRTAEFDWLKSNEQKARQSQKSSPHSGEALETIATKTAGDVGIALQRYEPTVDGGLRIWLENIPFESLVRWIQILATSQGISVQQVEIERKTPGIVNVSLILRE